MEPENKFSVPLRKKEPRIHSQVPLVNIVPLSHNIERLDTYLSSLPDLNLSRSQIKKLIEDNLITVNDRSTEPSYKIKPEDHIKIIIPPPAIPTAKPEDIPLDIIFEDGSIIVVNKPRGMVTHPAPGNYSGTLVNALLHHTKLASLGAPLRPGIVHRLDKDTSGLIVAAKTDTAYHSLVKQLKNRTMEKTYVALVHGMVKNNEGVIEARIGRHPVHRKKMSVVQKGREALTSYKVLRRYKNYTLVEVKIKTGRTHQIRVHFSHIGHPLVGDPTYGGKKGEFELKGQLLHAKKLGFVHPVTGKFIEFETGLPPEMERALQKIA